MRMNCKYQYAVHIVNARQKHKRPDQPRTETVLRALRCSDASLKSVARGVTRAAVLEASVMAGGLLQESRRKRDWCHHSARDWVSRLACVNQLCGKSTELLGMRHHGTLGEKKEESSVSCSSFFFSLLIRE